jgi:hypothetical protein
LPAPSAGTASVSDCIRSLVIRLARATSAPTAWSAALAGEDRFAACFQNANRRLRVCPGSIETLRSAAGASYVRISLGERRIEVIMAPSPSSITFYKSTFWP